MNYVKNLRFEDKPDYEYLIKLFKYVFHKNNYEMDYDYSWSKVRKEKMDKEEAKRKLMEQKKRKEEEEIRKKKEKEEEEK